MANSIKKVLVANRGEIAVRVTRACRELDIATVAVYSEVDADALHVRMADEAYLIGPPPSSESYLVQEKILQIAQQSGADALHPGYGFLSENPGFAERVNAAGIRFIGPPSAAMRVMGDKTAARDCMRDAGIPTVPGSAGELTDEKAVSASARELGYPVLLKAAAGGGGKGMRVVHDERDIASAFRAARSEAQSAFGDGRVYLEKYLEEPRHIEFQILADTHGNVVHLGERECSIQRRHQKVIEEAPSTALDDELRTRMGEAAVEAARACDYQNAGTIEFMLDKRRNFYFLEMNTRLQVEHPVTELVTGIDLVKEQIRVAAGEQLGYSQSDIKRHGHAIECRIYAEDATNNFMPSTGRITFMHPPSGPGVREDSGYYGGGEVPIYYDPMISKLIVWGRDRSEAIARMRRALDEYLISGVETSIPFCAAVMQHEAFITGNFDTHFIEKEFLNKESKLDFALQHKELHDVAVVAAALFQHESTRQPFVPRSSPKPGQTSKWKLLGRQIAINQKPST